VWVCLERGRQGAVGLGKEGPEDLDWGAYDTLHGVGERALAEMRCLSGIAEGCCDGRAFWEGMHATDMGRGGSLVWLCIVSLLPGSQCTTAAAGRTAARHGAVI